MSADLLMLTMQGGRTMRDFDHAFGGCRGSLFHAAMDGDVISCEQLFTPDGLKHRGITDTKGLKRQTGRRTGEYQRIFRRNGGERTLRLFRNTRALRAEITGIAVCSTFNFALGLATPR